jgi:hypothetical protein
LRRLDLPLVAASTAGDFASPRLFLFAGFFVGAGAGAAGAAGAGADLDPLRDPLVLSSSSREREREIFMRTTHT